jgi:peptide chain release factor subunit 1
MDESERAAFNRTLAELKTVTQHGETHVSVYVPPDKSLEDAASLMGAEESLARNVKNRQMRESAKAALHRALVALLDRARTVGPSPTGLAVFTTRARTWVVVPPSPIDSFVYRCGSAFVLEPLEELSADPALYGLIVIDYKEATLGFLRGKRIEAIAHHESNIMGKHDAGGQSQRRFERIMENERSAFLEDILRSARQLYLPSIKECRLDGLLIGGPGMTKEAFADLLSDEPGLGQMLLKPLVDTGYTEEYGLRELVNGAKNILRETALVRETGIVDRFFAAVHSGKAIYGKDAVRSAVEAGAVDTLLLSPFTDTPEMRTLAVRRGTSVLHISNDSEAGERFRQFGGIGAFLRYGTGV